jgi:hypothetical protein
MVVNPGGHKAGKHAQTYGGYKSQRGDDGRRPEPFANDKKAKGVKTEGPSPMNGVKKAGY